MKRLALAVLSISTVAGLAATASPARAGDDVSVGFFFGGSTHGHGASRGWFGVDLRRSFDLERARVYRGPRFVPTPAYPPIGPSAYPMPIGTPMPYGPTPYPAPTPDATCGCPRWIPAHDVCRDEVVCEPAVYEDRCVPIFDTVCVPVYDEVRVPTFEERCIPVFERVLDPRTGRAVKGKVGERIERVQVGERLERVQVGERKERVKVGERTERVLVRAEVCRTVPHHDRVPGRYVTVVADRREARGLPGEILTQAEYDAEMAQIAGGSAGLDPRLAGANPDPTGDDDAMRYAPRSAPSTPVAYRARR